MKIYSVIVVAVLLLGNVSLYILYNKNKDKMDDISHSYEIDKYSLMNKVIQASEISGYSLNTESEVTDESGRKLVLNTLVKQHKKLFFRFTHLNCESCIEAILPLLNKFSEKFGKENIIFLASYPNATSIKSAKNRLKITGEIYNINPSLLEKNSVEDINFPYFFVLNQDFTLHYLYIPEKSMTELSHSYFNKLLTD